VLDGKLEFLRMVKGIEDGTYKELKIRFNRLNEMKNKRDIERIDMESVLNVLETKGLESALNLFERFKIKNRQYE
jgi:hypothetical protein